MFGLNDIPKFFLAFFLVLPIISFLHEAGHVFFAWLMGGKNIKITVGTGKVLFRFGMLEVRQYYFWYGFCTFDSLKRNHRLANILIFSGGALFNALSVVAVVYLVENNKLEPSLFTYQFTYFSLYYVFFAMLPMPYPGGNASDGKVMLDLVQKKQPVEEKTYRVCWCQVKSQWHVLDPERKLMQAFTNKEQALDKAQEVAQANRPSRVLLSEKGQETEVRNYPKVPL